MDPIKVLQQLRAIDEGERVLAAKIEQAEHNEHLARLRALQTTVPIVSEAIKRLEKNAVSCAYTRLSGLIEKRRRDVYIGKALIRRLARRKQIQSKIDALRKEVSARAASSADDERSKAWRQLIRKQIPRAAKQMASSYAARMTNAKRTAGFCMREVKKLWTRQGRLGKEAGQRSKKQMREMLLFWRKNEREERELRKRAEKEAAEARRLEEEQREARRQAKKLNFLLTQTELFSHFVAGKTDAGTPTTTAASKLKAGVDLADVEDDALKAHATQLAREAAERTKSHRDAFASNDMDFSRAEVSQTVRQPRMLQAELKSYQLTGLSWMAGLWEQGINGILADEMGLGKTIQAISLLAHLAETHNIWGPFIVVAPASTLHNWQQELARFVPSLRVLPYWGSVADRKSLRRFWPSTTSGRPFARDSTFHVMVTSYQLVVSDASFLQKIRWQYMVLDEAQAIKSSSSQRWNVLLKFACRNRLLLTGTPIQNTMQELWALLHFIMPSLFDSHDEFSDWFAKDIESRAASEGTAAGRSAASGMAAFDQHQLARLHMILKPFMLRRVKKDVQSELPAKRELDVLCDLAPKQRRLYKAIKQRLPVAELLKSAQSDAEASASLMNIVMQLRKVCNHPQLFEREPVVCPLVMAQPLLTLKDESKAPKHVWPGALPSAIDLSLPRDCDALDSQVSIRIDAPTTDSLSIRLRDAPELEDLVPVSLRFFAERWPRAYSPRAVAPPAVPVALPSSSDMPSTLQLDYMAGKQIIVPDFLHAIQDCGKLARLDALLAECRAGGHRVLIYNQMTRMIDLMEEYLQYRKYRYLRLDGSTRIADRRDMVNDWQTQPDIFCFLLSTRAGGLGINLTAADTVIFFDSDWNPTVDQQAMDRAHRLGQTRPVTVYRMLTRGTIEERIQLRAHQKDLVQKVVIAGGDFEQSGAAGRQAMRAKDVASLLLDEGDIPINTT